MESFHKNYNAKERKQMSKTDPNAVTQVKRTTGYAENQGSWPQVSGQHAYNISSAKWIYQIGVKQYGSIPYCVLCLSILQYIAILQYLIGFW